MTSPSGEQKRQSWAGWVTLVTGLISVASTVGLAFYAETETGPRITLAIVAAVAAGCALAFGFYKNNADVQDALASASKAQDLATQLEAERRRTRIVLTARLQAAALLVAGFAAASADERREKLSGLQTAMVEQAAALVGAAQPRASYFRIEGTDPRTMSPVYTASVDRNDETSREFVEGSGPGQAVWEIVDHGESRLVRDLGEEPDPELDDAVYKTYITVGVRAGSVPYGMLTLNALGAGELDDTDLAMLRILARLLAAAEAMAADVE